MHKKNIPATCILAETLTQYPDPRAAAEAVQGLNKLLDMDIDYEPLLKEAQDIESRLQKLAEEVTKKSSTTYLHVDSYFCYLPIFFL
ncbi:PAC2 family protein [Methanobrevibacter arboriphilus]|uniref:PAC2 family protein n=1 Tax=Methanobrevibacter arboriphilus TaxID=39441 RepID=UPI002982A45C|nr:PAC2 family protein [Methanobrevibacter arboriphilus]